jgi:hypothetical protein
MKNQNEAFLHLMDALPADVARRKAMGDIQGALRLIEGYLAQDCQRELFPRLEAEKMRLERLKDSYPYDRATALAMVREEWPGCTEEQFDALVDGRRMDWRMVDGQMHFHSGFLNSTRLYPEEAPGLKPEVEDHTKRNEMLARMEKEGGLSARITLKASIRAAVPSAGKRVQACPSRRTAPSKARSSFWRPPRAMSWPRRTPPPAPSIGRVLAGTALR